MAGWRFYGRERELEQVRTLLHLGDPGPQGRRWAAYTLLGRRGIGKKRLLAQAMEEKPDAVPVLTVELPDTGRRDDCLRTLERAITQSGLGSLMADRPEDTDGRWATANPQGRFTDILSHLIGKGAVVVLDEFHNARSAGIESPLKPMIDHFTSLPSFGRRSPPGTLVLTGSHQQHLLRMLRSDAPLHQRATALARIRQWPVSTTLEMAAEHGLLARPGRFLSLWTAWDGLPRNRERLIEDPQYTALLDPAAIADDDDWRRAFLQIERETLEDPKERVDSRAAVELSEDARAALIWMSHQSARGAGTREIASGAGLASRDAADRALRILETHLELVRWDGPMLAASPGRGAWRITDNNSLFQLNVFPDLFTSGRSAATTRRDPEMELTWLKNLEGPMLERLASGWVSSLPCGVWSETGVGFPQPGERGIDLVGLVRQNGDAWLVLGECTRNADRHDPDDLARRIADFRAALGAARQETVMHDATPLPMIVSPAFTSEQRRIPLPAGFCVWTFGTWPNSTALIRVRVRVPLPKRSRPARRVRSSRKSHGRSAPPGRGHRHPGPDGGFLRRHCRRGLSCRPFPHLFSAASTLLTLPACVRTVPVTGTARSVRSQPGVCGSLLPTVPVTVVRIRADRRGSRMDRTGLDGGCGCPDRQCTPTVGRVPIRPFLRRS